MNCRIGSRITEADFVLLVWTGVEELPAGAKVVLALFEGVPARSVPEGLAWYRVDAEDGYRDLLRHLRPLWARPPERGLYKGALFEEENEPVYSSPASLDIKVWDVAEPSADPPRTAYARLDAPDIAVAEEEIEVTVGLAEKPTPGVVGGPMTRPEASLGPYTLTAQLVAEGFRLREGETWRRELPVTAEAPWPEALFHLTPEPQEQEVRPRSLQAFYTVAGQTMGMAFRPLVVKRNAEEMTGTIELAGTPGVNLAIPTDVAAPDLEVRILLDPDRDGRLLWTFDSPHGGLDFPDEAVRTDIGNDPKGFARQLVDKVNAKEGKSGIYRLLAGIGVDINKAMLSVFWSLLRAVAARVGGPPDVLILSAEPYVPWELAKVEEPLIDPAAPPFLAPRPTWEERVIFEGSDGISHTRFFGEPRVQEKIVEWLR